MAVSFIQFVTKGSCCMFRFTMLASLLFYLLSFSEKGHWARSPWHGIQKPGPGRKGLFWASVYGQTPSFSESNQLYCWMQTLHCNIMWYCIFRAVCGFLLHSAYWPVIHVENPIPRHCVFELKPLSKPNLFAVFKIGRTTHPCKWSLNFQNTPMFLRLWSQSVQCGYSYHCSTG